VAIAAPRIAHGYDFEDGKPVDVFKGAHLLGVPTSVWGPVWTTVESLRQPPRGAIYRRALRRQNPSPATLAAMMQHGPKTTYGLGNYEMWSNGHAWQGNDGYFWGFTSVTMYDFSRKLTVTVLTNFTANWDAAL